jgi:menaquinone-dependent protoporphyrinogen oxidase
LSPRRGIARTAQPARRPPGCAQDLRIFRAVRRQATAAPRSPLVSCLHAGCDMRRILIAYASSYGQTRKIASTLADELRGRGHEVELADALLARPPPVEDYDAVVIGSRIQFGLHARPLLEYIIDNRAELHAIPSYAFVVSMAAAAPRSADPNGYVAKLLAITHWQPRIAVAIAGGLPYRSYHWFLRFVMKRISRSAGHSTDTRHDHEYTDWARVQQLAADIARDLAPKQAARTAAPHAQA